MSAFLGPIHFWLYNKIKIQNNIVEDILNYSEELNLNFRETMDSKFGKIDNRPLEELIDTTNIHGWLQNCVSIVEYRLAFAVTNLLKENPDHLDKIKEIYKNAGETLVNVNQNSTVSEVFKAGINDSLLDGMPCDHVNSIDAQKEDEITWKRTQCIHSKYWDSVGGDINNYYLLRDEFIKGFVIKAGATYEKLDDSTYKIKR